ncbi:MAG: hypothetical protein C5B49_03230, partial [Bdellovibrio sp.]
MVAWLTFIKERFPLPVYAVLCGGFAVTGARIAGNADIAAALVAFFFIMLFFFLLRTMDELKDYEKDVIANPTRPLPRGLLQPAAVAGAIRWIWLGTLVAGVAVYSASPLALFSFLAFWLYLWLMYKEFFVGHRLQNYPLIYAVSHQVILVPICVFAVAVHADGTGS